MMDAIAYLTLLLLPALVIIAALKDLTSFTIPNWISAAAILGFFPAAFAASAPLDLIGLHAAVGFVVLLAGMGMFALNWVGGGDAKLLAGSALWFGLTGIGPFLLFTAIAGGALTLILLNIRSETVRVLVPAGPAWLERLRAPGGHVPYGVAIAIGALAAFPTSTLVQLAAGAP